MLTVLGLCIVVLPYCVILSLILLQLFPAQSSARVGRRSRKQTALDRLRQLHDLHAQGAERDTQDVA